MLGWRRIIIMVLGGLGFCAPVQADMMSTSRPDIPFGNTPQVRISSDLASRDLLTPFDSGDVTNLDLLSSELLSSAMAHADPTGQTQAVQVFAKEPRSFDLCLYALMGLGLCKSAPWVKKLSFGHIPEWYHSAGPYQIGHSFAISPDCLCSTPVCCFVQPDDRAESRVPGHRFATLISGWRNSQFTPATFTSRGPPSRT
jgi:hypothetical protein